MADKVPMETEASQTAFRCHGIDYIRTGSCNRCGECGCEVRNCPHFTKKNEMATCSIFDKIFEPDFRCYECEQNEDSYWYKQGKLGKYVTHKVCRVFPDHPYLGVILSGVCGYVFTPTTPDNKKKHDRIMKAFNL